ncbi:hypothetical protein ILUMI_04353 [Ignelater luminosus]|uniref:Transposable element P transposase n=1 Tax=Ignelater luminosus TaxID=2038154 RepID=A0A8K0GJN3_IGNLU|nr:hypothetical protein ILUMI_04353 [Ignelater luminosus]
MQWSENAVALVKAQVDLKNKPPTGRRFSEDYKQFTLKLYFTSPKAYKFLEKGLILPSIRSLQRRTQNVHFKPGFNDFVFAALKLKLSSTSEKEKCCTICIDEMSLKSALFYNVGRDEIIGFHNEGDGNKYLPAQFVMVTMVRDIYKNFKQPRCYFFTNTMCKDEKLKSITLNCIEKLQIESGANVRAVVSDQGSNFRELVKSLGISAEKPYFIVNEKKIYYFYDVPHLIKSVRNNILQYDITFKDNKGVTWKHIQAFYKSYESKPLRLAPKLTQCI